MKPGQVSLRGTTYAKLKAEAERRGERISDFVSRWIEEDLDQRQGTKDTKKPKEGQPCEVEKPTLRGAGYHEF